jgi:hypothetical protein
VDSRQQNLYCWWPVQDIVYDFSFPEQVAGLVEDFKHKFLSLTSALQGALLPSKVALLQGTQAENSELGFDNFDLSLPRIDGEEGLEHIGINAAQVADINFVIEVRIYLILHEGELNNNGPLIVKNVLQNWSFDFAQSDLYRTGFLLLLLRLREVFFQIAFKDVLI